MSDDLILRDGLRRLALAKRRAMELMERAGTIWCPYCGVEYDFNEDHQVVSYWGEDGEVECECQSCEGDFMCTETVVRTFDTRKRDES